MPLTDIAGHLWAHKDTVKVGDVLITDGGFTCMGNHERKIVRTRTGFLPHWKTQPAEGSFERLYIECADGTHGLDGQVGDDGELIGLYRPDSFDGEHTIPPEPEPDPPVERAAA